MHDIRLIRDDPAAFDAAMARRGAAIDVAALLDADQLRRSLLMRSETIRAKQKGFAGQIGRALAEDDQDAAHELKDEVARLKSEDAELASISAKVDRELRDTMESLPNKPADDVPDGKDESSNSEIARWGALPIIQFTPREHADLGPPLGLDFETGARIAGARFTFLRGQMARLQRALGQFMLDRQVAAGFTECAPPLLVKDEAVFGTGQLPKFADDLFATDLSLGPAEYTRFKLDAFGLAQTSGQLAQDADLDDRNVWNFLPSPPTRRWLIPTAEVSLTNSVREQILADAALPIRMTALTPCFRSEAGAAGKDTRGYIRQHQFEKVELVSICRPEESEAEHERMVEAAEAILRALELPYRKMLLCAGDMGFTARKTYDLEVWLPGQDAYREISSVSNCGDFQARRMNARYRPAGEKGTQFVHTLNGSGLAVGRTLVAVLENYQEADGSVSLPQVLHAYMGGMTRLVPPS